MTAAAGNTARRKRESAGNEKSCCTRVAGLSRENFNASAAGANTSPPCAREPLAAETQATASTGPAMPSNRAAVQLRSGAEAIFPAAASCRVRAKNPRHIDGNFVELQPRHKTAAMNASPEVRSRLRAT